MVSLFRVPFVRPSEAVLTLVGNLFFPGLATALLGLVIVDKEVIIIGLLQLLATVFFFLGWLWALIFSILLLLKSRGVASGHDPARAASSPASHDRTRYAKREHFKRERAAERAAEKAVAAVREPPPIAAARRSRTRASDCHYCRDQDGSRHRGAVASRRRRQHRHRR